MTAAHRKAQCASTAELIDQLVAECRDPARLLELYYWSTEPGLLPIIRGFASLPRETQARLELFLWPAEPSAANTQIAKTGHRRTTSRRGGTLASAGQLRPRRRA